MAVPKLTFNLYGDTVSIDIELPEKMTKQQEDFHAEKMAAMLFAICTGQLENHIFEKLKSIDMKFCEKVYANASLLVSLANHGDSEEETPVVCPTTVFKYNNNNDRS